MSLNVIQPALRPLVSKLIKQRVTNVQFGRETVSLDYDHHHFTMALRFPKHVKMIASWGKNPRGLIRIDRDMKLRIDRLRLAVHETIEKYLTERYGLSPCVEAHYVAEAVEHVFSRRIHASWSDYSERIEFEFRKENPKLMEGIGK